MVALQLALQPLIFQFFTIPMDFILLHWVSILVHWGTLFLGSVGILMNFFRPTHICQVQCLNLFIGCYLVCGHAELPRNHSLFSTSVSGSNFTASQSLVDLVSGSQNADIPEALEDVYFS